MSKDRITVKSHKGKDVVKSNDVNMYNFVRIDYASYLRVIQLIDSFQSVDDDLSISYIAVYSS